VKLGHPEAGEAHLADRSAMMRAIAQWAARREGRTPATLYRKALATDSAAGRTRALVAGLGECGTHRDVDVLLPFLEHASPRVRAEAVRAVRRLGGSPTQVARMLADPAPVVVRATHAALRTQPDASGLGEGSCTNSFGSGPMKDPRRPSGDRRRHRHCCRTRW
jgi:hypothetical protein